MMLTPSLLTMWAAVAGLGLALALVAVRAANTAAVRGLAVALALGLAGAAYLTGERVLGHARPVRFEAVQSGEAQVLYANAIREKGIFLLVATDDVPLYYQLPWDEQTAKELRQALERAEREQAKLMFRFEPSLERREPRFYPLPQPAPADKQEPKPGLEYRDPEWRV